MQIDELYKECRQCPRACGVDRTASAVVETKSSVVECPTGCIETTAVQSNTGRQRLHAGFCREPADLRIAFAGLHFGEEPLVTVFGGSGTVFFTGCTLRCAFCQNYQISQDGMGRVVDQAKFVDICLRLQAAGAENINLVTGSHHIPRIAEYLRAARDQGVTIPFCWNSSAYESVEMLELLKDLVTIWLPDLKTLDSNFSKKVFAAPDYPEVASRAISWMIANNPLEIAEIPEPPNAKPAEWAEPGQARDKMTSGVIVRHLFMPGHFEETADVLAWLKENADGRAIISLMNQYTPVNFEESPEQKAARRAALANLENRLVTTQEDADIRDLIEAYDFDYLFYQELTDDTSWLPDFRRPQPFSNKLATPIWHCQHKL
ncbi:MAG: radical SAM protein [Treponema sp.]|nr:radical SAM protein [Treponema sp.]